MLTNREAIEKIYNNREDLMDCYGDMPETKHLTEKVTQSIWKTNLSKREKLDLDSLVGHYATQYEKQGFIYGFKYAISLLGP